MQRNAQYNLARPGSLPVRVAGHQRRKMFAAFVAATGLSVDDTVLDIGATSDRAYDHSNYLEAWWPHKSRITAVGFDDAGFLEELHPGLRFLRADGRRLPFPDGSFDVVHSSAVLEHVGNRPQQQQFVGEMWRVARRAVFLTTPNRWFPVEFHTMLPLLHWLPPRWYRGLLRGIGQPFFADEANLNLLSARDLAGIAETVGLPGCGITTVALCGLPTNLLLVARKTAHTPVRVAAKRRPPRPALEYA